MRSLLMLSLLILSACYTAPKQLNFDTAQAMQDWRSVKDRQPIIQGSGERTHAALVKALEDCRNTTVYITDQKNYGVSDYWATPDEYRANKGGDCEDTAICVYYSLRANGFQEEDLYLMLGNDGKGGHAALSVQTIDGLYVIDNQHRTPIANDDFMGKLFTASILIN